MIMGWGDWRRTEQTQMKVRLHGHGAPKVVAYSWWGGTGKWTARHKDGEIGESAWCLQSILSTL